MQYNKITYLCFSPQKASLTVASIYLQLPSYAYPMKIFCHFLEFPFSTSSTMSSANTHVTTSQSAPLNFNLAHTFPTIVFISFILNNIGDIQHPCLTPPFTPGVLNLFNLTYPLKSFSIGRVPLTHNAASRRVKRNAWFIDLKS